MSYLTSEPTSVLKKFDSGSTVRITLHDLSDDSIVPLDTNICTEVGSTGIFKWSITNITTPPSGFNEYLFIMTDTVTSAEGKLTIKAEAVVSLWINNSV